MGEAFCACGRKGCDNPAQVCVLCPAFTTRRPRHVETPQGCPDCRVKLAALPADIADAYSYLGEILEPRRGGNAIGATKAAEAPMPLAVDPYDLTAGHTVPQGPVRLGRLRENLVDQIGHLPVAAVLGTWVRDWAVLRDQGERGPKANVGTLADWLTVRTEWAVDHHPAVDEYTAELHTLRGVLQSLVGRAEPDERPKLIPGVPCVRCRYATLVRRHDGSVECQWPDCRRIYTAAEYETVTKAAAKATRKNKINAA